MNRKIAGAVLIAAIVAVVFFALNRPEPAPPTPKERLTEAAEEIREATQETAEAVSDATQDASEALANRASERVDKKKDAVAEAYADMAERVAQSSQDTQELLRQFLVDWKASGIVAEDGIDFDKAAAAVEASDLSADAKANVIAILTALRNAPGAFEENMDALETLLNT